jgi:hypothetical protein
VLEAPPPPGERLVDDFCDACKRNEPKAAELRRLRGKRGGYTSALSRAVDRFMKASEEAG